MAPTMRPCACALHRWWPHCFEVRDRATTVVELAVAAPDMGRIIGKGGRVIDSIRTLLQVRAAKEGRRVELELLEADELR